MYLLGLENTGNREFVTSLVDSDPGEEFLDRLIRNNRTGSGSESELFDKKMNQGNFFNALKVVQKSHYVHLYFVLIIKLAWFKG